MNFFEQCGCGFSGCDHVISKCMRAPTCYAFFIETPKSRVLLCAECLPFIVANQAVRGFDVGSCDLEFSL